MYWSNGITVPGQCIIYRSPRAYHATHSATFIFFSTLQYYCSIITYENLKHTLPTTGLGTQADIDITS
jgi:hypothetical protein